MHVAIAVPPNAPSLDVSGPVDVFVVAARQSGGKPAPAMSVRNFTRVFTSETGATPADFVELARVDAARWLPEDSETPLQRVAPCCGFGTADTR